MSARPYPDGFSVMELLVAMTITLSLAAALAQAVGPARAAFERVPAEADVQQRGRAATDLLAEAVRSAAEITLTDRDASGGYRSMSVMVPLVHGAQGILALDQATPGGTLSLDAVGCPDIKDVCGFTPGAVAGISDGIDSEVFMVAAVHVGARRLTPDRAFARIYAAGSTVAEVDAATFRLAQQADGSRSLVRETAAGAIQPAVDFLGALTFSPHSDRIDIAVTVWPASDSLRGVMPERVFRSSIRRRRS